MAAADRGIALLETLIALVILGTAGANAVAVLVESTDGFQQVAREERDVQDQSRLLTAISLLSRSDLEQRLGERLAGPYTVEVRHPEVEIYRVRVRSLGQPPSQALETALYRPGGR